MGNRGRHQRPADAGPSVESIHDDVHDHGGWGGAVGQDRDNDYVQGRHDLSGVVSDQHNSSVLAQHLSPGPFQARCDGLINVMLALGRGHHAQLRYLVDVIQLPPRKRCPVPLVALLHRILRHTDGPHPRLTTAVKRALRRHQAPPRPALFGSAAVPMMFTSRVACRCLVWLMR